jgi:hypothetical protein
MGCRSSTLAGAPAARTRKGIARTMETFMVLVAYQGRTGTGAKNTC